MEITDIEYVIMRITEFKIDLIVWKLYCMIKTSTKKISLK